MYCIIFIVNNINQISLSIIVDVRDAYNMFGTKPPKNEMM